MTGTIKLEFDRFFTFHFVIPFLVFAIAFSGLELAHLDIWVSQSFYDKERSIWPYQNHWLIEGVIHRWGSVLAWFAEISAVLCLLLSLSAKSTLSGFHRPLAFLVLAGLTGPIVIACLKNKMHVYCPWDLAIYGGEKPYLRLFDFAPPRSEVGFCFPAGHAGSGYAFICLYFFLYASKPVYKFGGLYLGLALGLVYGLAQQIRGAHFLSHDLFSLAVCWFTSLLLFILFFRKQILWL
ncbi:MAG: phosphatase PAP2 family protein [Gammaproteobacteria bacterium]